MLVARGPRLRSRSSSRRHAQQPSQNFYGIHTRPWALGRRDCGGPACYTVYALMKLEMLPRGKVALPQEYPA